MEFKDQVSVAWDVIALIAVAIVVLYVIVPPVKRWPDESFAVEADTIPAISALRTAWRNSITANSTAPYGAICTVR